MREESKSQRVEKSKSRRVEKSKSRKAEESKSRKVKESKSQKVEEERSSTVVVMERSIENLFIWTEARIVVNSIYKMLKTNRDYGFKDQIQRAAVSIMNNIAEGAESGSDAKFSSFLSIAKGSCGEVRSMLYLCEDLGYCTPETRIDLQNRAKRISAGITHLIGNLKK